MPRKTHALYESNNGPIVPVRHCGGRLQPRAAAAHRRYVRLIAMAGRQPGQLTSTCWPALQPDQGEGHQRRRAGHHQTLWDVIAPQVEKDTFFGARGSRDWPGPPSVGRHRASTSGYWQIKAQLPVRPDSPRRSSCVATTPMTRSCLPRDPPGAGKVRFPRLARHLDTCAHSSRRTAARASRRTRRAAAAPPRDAAQQVIDFASSAWDNSRERALCPASFWRRQPGHMLDEA